jgi:O-antigen/teichoic acid export membrane protein
MKRQIRKNFAWNMIGAGLTSFLSPLFLLIVSRELGLRDAGYFALAFTTGVLLSNIGLFNVRSYQITDIHKNHSDAVYMNARIATTTFMVLALILYSLTKISAPEQCAVILLLGLWRVPDVLADVMHGTMQMNGRLDLAGKSLLIKSVLCTMVFGATVLWAQNLILACILLVVVNVLVFIFYDIYNYRAFCPDHRPVFNREAQDLIRSCLPLFLISLFYAYLINAPKYTIDLVSTPEIQTIYSIIVLPAFVIWVIFLLILNPMLPGLAEMYFAHQTEAFNRQVRRLLLVIIASCAVYLVFMYSVGIRIFSAAYDVPLMSYRWEFLLAGIGSGFLCIATVFSYLLILIRQKYVLLFAYIGVTVLSAVSSVYFVEKSALFGATVSYLITTGLLMLAMTTIFWIVDQNRKEEEGYEPDGDVASVPLPFV